MSTRPTDTQHVRDIRTVPERRMLWLGAATALLYMGSVLLELQMSRNDISSSTSLRLAAWQMVVYVVLTVLVFWIYGVVLSMAAQGWLESGRARHRAFAVPVFVNLILLAWLPLQSQDVFSYLAHGFLGEFPGHNPLLSPPDDALDTPLGHQLSDFGWHSFFARSPYGILWTRLEVAIADLWGPYLWGAILTFKVLSLLASLASAYLIWYVVGRIRPQLQLQATLAYLWNPLVLVEFAGEGHNDSLMIALSIAALAACVTGRPALSIVLQVLGAMAKYVCVLFIPAQLIYLWRNRQSSQRLTLALGIAMAVSLTIAVILYWPFWAGPQTFAGVLHRTQMANADSVFGVLRRMLERTPLKPLSGPISSAAVALPLVALIAWGSLQVRTANDLARVCTWASLGFVLLTSPDYWPWYACLPIAWICIGELERLFWLAVLLSLAGRLTGPLEELRIHSHLDWHFARGMIEGLGAVLPFIALLGWIVRSGSRPWPRPAG